MESGKSRNEETKERVKGKRMGMNGHGGGLKGTVV
jgi:hypothetical protein